MRTAPVIERFYEAFGRCDGDGMAACYAPDVRFSDPVFPDLRGDRAKAMWRMLTSQASDLRVVLDEHDDTSARWTARYTFGQTGRPVVNRVHATFAFDDAGLITSHTDRFDFHRWARQALGPTGLLLGWTPIVRNAVRQRADRSLEKFMAATG
jgi:ketosteroid isomerase-like protein